MYDENIYGDGPELPLLRIALSDDEELLALPVSGEDVSPVQGEYAERKAQLPAAKTTAEWLQRYRDEAAAMPSGEFHRMETVDST